MNPQFIKKVIISMLIFVSLGTSMFSQDKSSCFCKDPMRALRYAKEVHHLAYLTGWENSCVNHKSMKLYGDSSITYSFFLSSKSKKKLKISILDINNEVCDKGKISKLDIFEFRPKKSGQYFVKIDNKKKIKGCVVWAVGKQKKKKSNKKNKKK